jgi:hypothetical protein
MRPTPETDAALDELMVLRGVDGEAIGELRARHI